MLLGNIKARRKIPLTSMVNGIPSSYKHQMVGHYASGFDNNIVVISLPSSYKCIKIMKTTIRLIKLNFKAGSVIEEDKEIPKYMKFVCSKCHISGSLRDIEKEYKTQPNFMKGEIDHDVINISNYKDYGAHGKHIL